MLKRDLSYELFSRELRALDELFSREPEDWAEWAGSARDYYTAKREPSPGNIPTKRAPYTSHRSPTPPLYDPRPGSVATPAVVNFLNTHNQDPLVVKPRL